MWRGVRRFIAVVKRHICRRVVVPCSTVKISCSCYCKNKCMLTELTHVHVQQKLDFASKEKEKICTCEQTLTVRVSSFCWQLNHILKSYRTMRQPRQIRALDDCTSQFEKALRCKNFKYRMMSYKHIT